MSIKATTLPEVFPASFRDLCLLHLPRPINDAVDYRNTVEVIDRLVTLKTRSNDQDEYLETLTMLVEKYDENFAETLPSDPIRRLRRLMDNHGLNASDLGRILGNRSLGSAILRGDREISKANAAKLGKHFKMNAGAFLQV